jgi:hypothetical protein
MTTAPVFYRWRQPRLSRGWTEVQLIGRMKIAANRDGVTLPKTYLLLRAVFLWENHRAPLPGYYARLLVSVFETPGGQSPVVTG